MGKRTTEKPQPDDKHPVTLASPSRLEAAIWGLIILVSVIWSLHESSRQIIDPDELQYLHTAWLWNQGVQPYTGFFHNHTPVYLLLLRPLLSGGNRDLAALVATARVESWLVSVLSIGAAFWLFERLMGRGPALYGAGLWAMVCGYDIHSVHIRPDMLMILLLLPGTALTVEGMGLAVGRGGSRLRTMLGGVLLMAAVCVLPKAVFWLTGMLAVAIAWALYSAAKNGDRSKLASLGMLGVGMTIPAVVQIAWIAAFSDFARFWFCVVTANGQLAGSLLDNHADLKRALSAALCAWPTASVLVALIGAAALATQEDQGTAFRTLLLAGLAAGGLLLVIMGIGPWLQYGFSFLVVVSGLGGMGLAWSYECFSPRARQCLGAAVLAMSVVWPWTNCPPASDEQGDTELKRSLESFQYVLDHARPGDTCAALINGNPVMMMDADPQQFGRLMCFGGIGDLRSAVATITDKQPQWVVDVDALLGGSPECSFSSLWLGKDGTQRIQLTQKSDGTVWLGTPRLGYVSADVLGRLYEFKQTIVLKRRDRTPN